MKSMPNDRLGWHCHYAKRFAKTRSEDTAVLAMWYLILHLAFDAPESEAD